MLDFCVNTNTTTSYTYKCCCCRQKSIGYYDSILGKIPNVRKRMIGLLTGCSSVAVNAEHHDLSVGRRGDRPRTGKFALNVQVFRVA
jgi:hypothetical protein